MKYKREIYKGRLLIAFLLTNLIFILIFLFSFSISYLNYKGISSQTNLLQGYVIELETFLNESSCNNKLLFEASEKLDIVGGKLSLLETRFGKKDPRVLEQKNLYNELEIKHFEIIKKLQENCDKNFTTILFFYSNNEPYEKESEKMGFVLGTFKNQNPEKIMVYSFDYDSEFRLIKELKTKYKINSTPITLINEKDLLYVRNIDDLEEYL